MAWLKGMGLCSLLILVPEVLVFGFEFAMGDPRTWNVFVLAVILIGTNPVTKYTKLTSDSESNTKDLDQNSVRLILIAGYLSVIVPMAEYFYFSWNLSQPKFLNVLEYSGFILAYGGLAFRVWAIRSLGAFFTAKVEILSGHELCRKGPYRWIRHPSYTGALFMFLSIPLIYSAYFSYLIVLPVWFIAYKRRIQSEEMALATHFGEKYESFKKESWALLPGIY